MRAAKPSRQRRVLVVEDQQPVRSALARYFSRRGWTVTEAPEGSAALEQIRKSPVDFFDLIISDVKMPGLSGIDLHSTVARERPDLIPRFVFSTGDSSGDDAAEFLAKANARVIPKPFELSQLDQLLDEIETA